MHQVASTDRRFNSQNPDIRVNAGEPNKAELHFIAKTDLVIEGRMHIPSDQSANNGSNVQRFFLAAWVGAGSKEFSLSPIALDGTAVVRLSLAPKDVDTVKLAVTFNMSVPKGTRNCHLASSFIPVKDLLANLAQAPKIGAIGASASSPGGLDDAFPASLPCMSMRDNFTKNMVTLRFRDVGSASADAIAKLELTPSSLHSLDRTNAAVRRLGMQVRSHITKCAISPLNAGPQYVEAFTFGQMQNHLTHYSILGNLLSSMSTPYDLPWIMYDAYQTVQSTGIHPSALGAMSDTEFVTRFCLNMINRHTSCALSSVYCSDYTVTVTGQTCKLKETEDISKTFSKLSLETQTIECTPFIDTGFAAAGAGGKPTLAQCLSVLCDAQQDRRSKGHTRRASISCISDDCENAAEGIMMKGTGLANMYESLLEGVSPPSAAPAVNSSLSNSNAVMSSSASTPPSRRSTPSSEARPISSCASSAASSPPARPGLSTSPLSASSSLSALHASLSSKLVSLMVRVGRGDRRFVNLTAADHAEMAPVLVRMGSLFHSGSLGTSFAVVSAKGPSYTENGTNPGGGLSGHGTVIARIRDSSTGMCRHFPVEGTTYLAVDPPPAKGYATNISVRLADGSGKAMEFTELATVLGQNVHHYLGATPDGCVLAHIKSDYPKGAEPPFFKAVFYSGLSEGGVGSMGCVPLDTEPPADLKCGSKPLFGAPVLGLSHPSTMAVPVGVSMLADTPAECDELHGLIRKQVSEAWSPEADPKTIATIASYWRPCESLSSPGIIFKAPDDAAKHIRSETTWAYDHPTHASAAVHYYQAVASRFNTLQASDPQSDGVRAHAYGQYLSVCLRLTMPVPLASSSSSLASSSSSHAHVEPIALSTIRNLRKAAAEIGMSKLVNCPLKMAQINARAKVESGEHFYMCDQGNGPVHAHRVLLA